VVKCAAFGSLPELDERRANVPMGRYGTSAEFAATISFLASDGAACITGQSLKVDGGLIRGGVNVSSSTAHIRCSHLNIIPVCPWRW
jgi:NAD(P)-dependent dehydrogenase (short-subunit alcohol dehydrogenase family)